MWRKKVILSNDGKNSEAIFVSNIAGLVIRLRDKRDLMGINKGKKVATFGNPSDFLIAGKHGLYFAEVKSTTSKTSFSLSGFTPTQKATMAKLVNRGIGDLYKIFIHSVEFNKWYFMDATEYVTHIKQGKKSIKWKNLNTLTAW